jgi:hypothetical protein
VGDPWFNHQYCKKKKKNWDKLVILEDGNIVQCLWESEEKCQTWGGGKLSGRAFAYHKEDHTHGKTNRISRLAD